MRDTHLDRTDDHLAALWADRLAAAPLPRHDARELKEWLAADPRREALLAAHRDLETLVVDRESMHIRDSLIPKYAQLVYNGFWFAPEREAIQALVTETQKTVSGEVRLKLYKGNVMQAGRRSPFSMYSEAVATMEGGQEEAYNQDDATGFITLNALRLKASARQVK